MTASWKPARLWIAAAFLLLAACAPGAGGPEAAPSPSAAAVATQPSTETPTIQWFPATSTPTPLPTAAVTPTPDQRPGIGAALLEHGIAASQPWTVGKSAEGTVSLTEDELTLAVSSPRATLLSLLAKPALGDFYAEVSADPSLCRGGDAFGLLLRAGGSSSFYRWTLTCDGQERLERVQNGAFLALQPTIPRAAPPAPNRLGVWVSGKDMHFFIDDIFQFAVSDPIFPTGSIGVFARSAADTPVTVTFSDLTIHALASLPTLPPSPPATP